uniref:Ig-like domain-containing protein n=1 Tax=Rousettus aegyptiacus TaxID=9407 RepID=A0A7J8CIJ7_ROUAE|nr:hypothetical protein HJG63_009133 [Rousettus aegyptiacus]
MVLPVLWLGLLSHVLMEVTKIPVEEGLCTAVPCKLEFSKDSPSNSMIIGYWLNKNISFPIAINQPSVTRDNNTDGRFHIIWNLEEQDCTLLIHNVLKKDNMTYLSYAEPGKQKSALLKNITLSMSGLTQKPELYIRESLVAGKPVTLTCTIRGPCMETKVLFLSWKGPTMSFNTDGSSNSSSSSVLHFTPKPEDRDTTLQCRLNSLPSLTRSNNSFLVISPPVLFYSSCSFGKILRCNCSFYGIPTPTVRWFMKGIPVNANNMDNILQVTSSVKVPWNNSTISLLGKPEIVMSLRCEGKNRYGIHASSFFLIPDKSSISRMFVKGLVQGIVYGFAASSLFFFFLVLFARKVLKWWKKRQIRKDEEALIKRQEQLEEQKTFRDTGVGPAV